jgi:hypothetical protein
MIKLVRSAADQILAAAVLGSAKTVTKVTANVTSMNKIFLLIVMSFLLPLWRINVESHVRTCNTKKLPR